MCFHEDCYLFTTDFHLLSDLQLYRGGCIICMDYSAYSYDYGYLLGNYKAIAQVLTDKLIALRNHSFRARDAHLFGFSYGARLIAKAGIDFGPKEIGNIDRKCFYYFRAAPFLEKKVITRVYLTLKFQYVNQLDLALKILKQTLIQNWLRRMHNAFTPLRVAMEREKGFAIKIGRWATVARIKLVLGRVIVC